MKSTFLILLSMAMSPAAFAQRVVPTQCVTNVYGTQVCSASTGQPGSYVAYQFQVDRVDMYGRRITQLGAAVGTVIAIDPFQRATMEWQMTSDGLDLANAPQFVPAQQLRNLLQPYAPTQYWGLNDLVTRRGSGRGPGPRHVRVFAIDQIFEGEELVFIKDVTGSAYGSEYDSVARLAFTRDLELHQRYDSRPNPPGVVVVPPGGAVRVDPPAARIGRTSEIAVSCSTSDRCVAGTLCVAYPQAGSVEVREMIDGLGRRAFRTRSCR